MRKFRTGMRRKGAFTLIELLMVVTIVAILALIAIPLFTANTTAAIMSEGIAGAGMMKSQLRVYLSNNAAYTGASYSASSNNINIGPDDLNGRYFAPGDYSLAVASSSQFTITAGPPSKTTRTGMPKYQINQDGSETSGAGYYTSGY